MITGNLSLTLEVDWSDYSNTSECVYFVEGRLWPVALPLGKFIDLANKSKNVA